ncbi:endonuclease domain-containing protein [uncultured Sphingomonas sp.]|uniref:endonuclease domain-containing protein n=1 Tax=uncultured Sphingomonas sp. TaxID=158754 RepID=UPI0025F8C8A0|nr:endonuclease domain-containing protein [uncultured Sphingomonas sp.]
MRGIDYLKLGRGREWNQAPTDAELALWQALSARKVAGVRFNRQVKVPPYVCDLVARSLKLVVEVDGGQHAVNAAEDALRTRYLEAKGYRVVRFWNNDVLGNLDGVVAEIERVIAAMLEQPRRKVRNGAVPSPNPSRKREGSDGAEATQPAHPFRLREGSGEGLSKPPRVSR